jgi:hypothetical protein
MTFERVELQISEPLDAGQVQKSMLVPNSLIKRSTVAVRDDRVHAP